MKFSLQKKTVVFVLLIAVTIACVAAAISYSSYTSTMDEKYRTTAMDLAATTASLVDADKVASYAQQTMEIYRQNPAPEFSDAQAEQAYYDSIFPFRTNTMPSFTTCCKISSEITTIFCTCICLR